MRVFAPSETKAARTQLGSGRFKTDDRDCAALTYLARQGAAAGAGSRRYEIDASARGGASPSRVWCADRKIGPAAAPRPAHQRARRG